MPRLIVDPGQITVAQMVDEAGAILADFYWELEQRLLARLARLAERGIPAPEDVAARLRAAQIMREATLRELRASQGPEFATRFLQLASERGTLAALDMIRDVPRLPLESLLQGPAARAIEALTFDLRNRLQVMEQRILRWSEDAYQRVIAAQAPFVLAGQVTAERARRAAVQQFLSAGIDGFTDVSGREWRIGTYAEMATRTATLRAWSDSAVHTMRGAGINLVSVVVGNDACAMCGAWVRKILSTDGTPAGVYEMPGALDDAPVQVRVDATVDEARAQGLQHPNCRCTVVAYLPGLSVVGAASGYDPVYTQERERLRELERDVRGIKRRMLMPESPAQEAELKQELAAAQKAIRDHVDESTLHRQGKREQLWFPDGHPERIPSRGPVKPVSALKPHEQILHERMAARGHVLEWIPESPRIRGEDGRWLPGVATSDFRWLDNGGLEVEARTVMGKRPNYGTMKGQIQKGAKQGKENFLYDLGAHELTQSLERLLSQYNSGAYPIRRLWVLSENGSKFIRVHLAQPTK